MKKSVKIGVFQWQKNKKEIKMKKPSNYSLKIVIVLILSLFYLPKVQNKLLAQDKAAKIDELMKKYHEYGQFNGSVLVAEKGKVIYKKGIGFANMEWEIPNQPDTKFRLGSITKQFTSMLIMQLNEEGKLKLEDRLSQYLPDYRKDTGEQVTIHHLLTHTSGIPNCTSLPGFIQDVSRDPYTVEEFIKKYCSGDMEFTPGSQYRYSNSGYFLLGAVIEKITGQSYEKVLMEKIWDPLNMKNTGYDYHAVILKKRAAGYRKTMDGYVNAPYLDMSLPYAAGALYSTVEDLYLWDQALYTDQLLSPKRKKIMFTPHLRNYAYGWGVLQQPYGDQSKTIITHGGGINGFNTTIVRLVDDKHLIVLLNNTGRTKLNEMSRAIANVLYGLPYEFPKKSIGEILFKTITQKDIAAALKQYRQLKTTRSDIYDFQERELNTLGYHLLGNKKIDEAIEIFKLNVENFPKASNTYDSLGEAYMIKGNKQLAIKNYKKSLELNPRNQNAVEKLKELEKK
jgi:CubicO group peptidase (beta-lactamase class C family)